jgi:hypothetical protein
MPNQQSKDTYTGRSLAYPPSRLAAFSSFAIMTYGIWLTGGQPPGSVLMWASDGVGGGLGFAGEAAEDEFAGGVLYETEGDVGD